MATDPEDRPSDLSWRYVPRETVSDSLRNLLQ